MNIDVKRLSQDAVVPTRGTEYAAGYDLYASLHGSSAMLCPGETAKIGTGISVSIPAGYFGAVFARSGLAAKQGLRPANCVGVIDSDYRGEIIVALHNDSEHIQEITDKERIAQLVIIPYLPVEFREVDQLDPTARGSGGFGSTGTR